MCGRYSIYTEMEQLAKRFDAAAAMQGIYVPHFNAAPSFALPVILNANPGEIVKASWGFLPHWAAKAGDSPAKEGSKIRPQINARGETVAEKPLFREAFKNKRCLVLADSFFEWDKKAHSTPLRASKTPYCIGLKNEEPFDSVQGKPFAFAGIWDEAQVDDRKLQTFAIITTEANALVGRIHDRMPVILKKEDEEDWLNPALKTEDAVELLKPYPEELMQMYEVSKKVNSPQNDTPDILKPAG